MRIPGPAGAFTGGESLPALHGAPDHGEFGQNHRWTRAVLKEFLIAAALIAPVSPGLPVRGFEPPATRYGRGHRGTDYAATPGQPVVSPIDGVVTFAGRVNDRSLVTVATGAMQVSVEPVLPSVQVGEQVDAGQRIGDVGTGGHCSLRCIHLGVRVGGEYVNPLESRRRLLPY